MIGVSVSHLLLILVIVLLIFGAGKVPEIMENLAQGLKAFKRGLLDDDSSGKKDSRD